MRTLYRKIAGLALCCTTACSSQAQVKGAAFGAMLSGLLAHSVPELSVSDLAAERQEEWVLLDAREHHEYEVSHLKGARWVGYKAFDPTSLRDLPRSARVVVYCSVGYRSEKVAEKLLVAGFSDVHNLYGGIFEWVNQGHPVVDAKGSTRRVHAYDRTWGVWLNKGDKVY